jgi:hypothetical protein
MRPVEVLTAWPAMSRPAETTCPLQPLAGPILSLLPCSKQRTQFRAAEYVETLHNRHNFVV